MYSVYKKQVDCVLKHSDSKKHKYIRKEVVNGKTRYYYEDDKSSNNKLNSAIKNMNAAPKFKGDPLRDHINKQETAKKKREAEVAAARKKLKGLSDKDIDNAYKVVKKAIKANKSESQLTAEERRAAEIYDAFMKVVGV